MDRIIWNTVPTKVLGDGKYLSIIEILFSATKIVKGEVKGGM